MNYKTLQNNITKTAGYLDRAIENAALTAAILKNPDEFDKAKSDAKLQTIGAGGVAGGVAGGTLARLLAGTLTENKSKRRNATLLGAILGSIAGGYAGNRYMDNKIVTPDGKWYVRNF